MIFNKTTKTTVSRNHMLCKSSFSKARGLMFRLRPKALIFVFEKPKIVALHMFFVFFPIDVIYLDKKKEVIEIKEQFMPFSFYTPKKKASYVVELPVLAVES